MKHRLGVIGFSCYACFAAASSLSGGVCLIISLVLIAAAAVPVVIQRAAGHVSAVGKSAAALFIAASAVFFAFYGIYSLIFIEPCASLYGEAYALSAKALEVTYSGSDSVRITAQTDIDGKPVKFSLFTPDTGIASGDTFIAEIKFSEPVDSAVFSESSYSYSRGIFLRASANTPPILIKREPTGASGFISGYSAYLRTVCARYLTGGEGGLIKAMFFGDKSTLSPTLSQNMKNCGLAHLTAVSGMHLSLFVNFTALLLGAFGLRSSRRLKFAAVAVITAILVFFFGFKSSVMRSAIMMLIYYGSLPLKRKPSPADSLGFAVLLILLAEPYACRDIGLLLSVSGTVGISASGKLFSFKNRVISALVSALCASLCTLPAAAVFFGGASTVSPIASVLCYPLFALIMALMALFAVTGGLLAEPLLFTAGLAAKAMKAVADTLGSFRFSFISFDRNLLPLVLLAAAYIAVSAFLLRTRRHIIKSAIIAVCVLAAAVTAHKALFNETAKVRVYSDGTAGMITIETAEGISLYSRGGSGRLYSSALSALSESCSRRFMLTAVIDRDNYGVYSQGFGSLPAIMTAGPENAVYSVGDEYAVKAQDGVIRAEIYGTSLVLAPAGSKPSPADITVYSGYRKRYGADGGTLTVFCAKRSEADGNNRINAYYNKTEILINKDGKILLRG